MLTKAQYHHDQQSSEHESLQSCMACDQQYKLKHRSHTPEFLRRPFILTGYRVYLSYANCLKSFFHLHNESVNVWTHAIGVVYIIYRYIACILMWQLLTSNQVQASDKSSVYNNNSSTTPYLDLGIFSLFYLAALTMLTCSSTYHLCCCHSESAHSDLLNIDMLGIVVMIYGTYIAGLYAAFSCSPFIQAYYMLALTVAVVVCVCILKATKVKEAEYRWLRVSSLLLVIMYAVNPIYYWFQLSPPFQLTEFSGHVFVMLMCYAIGFSFYSSKLPEAKRPGYFDIWFSSHQLWHIFILLGTCIWEAAVFNMFVLRLSPQAYVYSKYNLHPKQMHFTQAALASNPFFNAGDGGNPILQSGEGMEQRIGGYPFELSGDTSAELYDFADGQYLRSLCSVFSSLSPYTQWLPSLFSSSSSVASPSSPSLAYPQASMFATLFFGSASAGNNPSHVEGMVFDRWWCEA